MDGLFKNQLPIVEDDEKIRFYADCAAYIEGVEEAEESHREALLFETMEPLRVIPEKVFEKTGIVLTKEEAELCWNMCRYELAWYPGFSSPWCALFSEQDIKAYEFREDLHYYYVNGYGYNITRLMTQPLWSDLMGRLESLQQNGAQEDPNIVLLFGHSETVHPFIASLGIHKDLTDLKASDWPAEKRKWRTSRICSFAANLDIIVNQCQVKGSTLGSELRVSLFHQETEIAFPSGLSTLQEFIQQYQYLADTDFNELCDANAPVITVM